MSEREPESVDFAPQRLSGGGRRIDPMAIGALVVVMGLGLAILKPWGGAAPEASAGPTTSPGVEAGLPAASDRPAPSGEGSSTSVAELPSPLAGARLATVLGIRHEWGVRAVTRDRWESDELVERWQAIDPGVTPGPPIRLSGTDHGVVAIGLTFPPTDAPLDIRAWRPTSDGTWEWLDTAPVGRSLNSGFLLPPPRVGEVRTSTWPGGHYRLDVLTATGITTVDVAIADPSDQVPGPTPATPGDRTMRSPLDPDLGVIPPGRLFAVVDGTGIPMMGGPTQPTSPAIAWLDPDARPGSPDPVSLDADQVNGLGVTFPVGATGIAASITRVAPDESPVVGARRAPGLHFGPHGRLPFVVFRAPGSTTWAAGTYRLDVAWSLDGVPRSASYHAVLEPGPGAQASDLLLATRSFASIAGSSQQVGATGDFATTRSLDCTGEPDPVVMAMGPSPTVIGIGHDSGTTPREVRAEMLLDGGRVADVPLVTVRGALPGLTVVAPADGFPFNPGVHRLRLGDAPNAPSRLVCIGVGGPP